MSTTAGLTPGDHCVHFYDDDVALAETVVGTLSTAIQAGEAALIIALPEHEDAFLAGFRARGLDVREARRAGRVVCLDAAEIAAHLVSDGSIDPRRFEDAVGDLVRRMLTEHEVIHVYGEIVAVLWGEGHVVAALELERMWNDLLDQQPVALLCAYPTELVDSDAGIGGYQRICALHNHVVDAPPVAAHAETSRRFPGSPPALSEARRFVVETLERWNLRHLAATTALVVNELASNAIEHADSAFSVALQRADRSVRVSVGDHRSEAPAPRTSDPTDQRGRGLALVEALCADWGYTSIAGGKLVWADIDPEKDLL
jgi:anti-sigma regulatory factor (Ser/Thr protein kinase)